MKVGIIGLGRMGMALVQNLLDHKYEVVAFNRSPEPRKEAEGYGAVAATSMNDFYSKLSKPKILWMMVTAGEATEAVFKQCVRVAKKGDIIIDGGNSFFKDTLKRGEICDKKGIYFLLFRYAFIYLEGLSLRSFTNARISFTNLFILL